MQVTLSDQVLRLRVADVSVGARHVEVEVVEVEVAPVAQREDERQRRHLRRDQRLGRIGANVAVERF